MSLLTRHHLRVFFSSLVENNNEPFGSSLFLFSFSSLVKDDDELGFWLIIILDFFLQSQKTTTSLLTCHRLLVFFSFVIEYDKEPRFWLIVVLDYFFFNYKRQQLASQLVVVF